MMNRSCVVALCAAIAFVAAPAYAAITISLKPARTSGVSPLYVFFDATGTTSPDVSDPFGDLLYQWNFGDTNPVSGGGAVWAVSGKPKNTATGPVAAHVYECAGPSNCAETVTLTVREPNGTVNSATTTITVYPSSHIDGSAPGSKTVCVSASGDFTGCPNGAARVASSANFTSILSSQIDGNGMRRVLFRRGDTWSASGSYTLKADGPGIIGAFGDPSLSKPFVDVTSNLAGGPLLACYGFDANGGGSGADWRIEDLKVQGGPNESSTNGSFVDATYGHTCTQLLLYGIEIANPSGDSFWASFGMNPYDAPSGRMHDQVALVGSTANRTYGYQAFWGGKRSAMLGNDLENSSTTHIARVACAEGMVISDNTFSGAGTTREELKLHADEGACPGYGSHLHVSHSIEVSDNRFASSQGSYWSVTLTGNANPETSDEIVQDLIFERNWVGPAGIGSTNPGSSQVGVIVGTMHGIYRNNIMVGTGGYSNPYQSFAVFSQSPKYTATNNQFYNNTCYASDVGTRDCIVVSSASDTTIKNNLLYKPNPTEGASGSSVVAICAGSNCVADHNVALVGAGVTDPFVKVNPQATADFELQSGANPALGAGVAVPIFLDFGLRMRGATRDAGAWSLDPSSGTIPAAPILLQ